MAPGKAEIAAGSIGDVPGGAGGKTAGVGPGDFGESDEGLEEGQRGASPGAGRSAILRQPRVPDARPIRAGARRPDSFLAELSDSRRVLRSSTCAGHAHVIASVAAMRRRRTALRSILVNELDGVEARLHALDAGFDEALTSLVTTEELVGRLAILARRSATEGIVSP